MMFQIKPSVKDGVAVSVYPRVSEPAERQPKNQINSSPRKKYGSRDHDEDRRQDAIERTARRHAATAPTWSR